MDTSFWKDKRVCVTGGAALIGSHLVEALLQLNPKNLWVADDLSSGKAEYLPKSVYLRQLDLRNIQNAKSAVHRADVVIHLAAQHGGRGYVNTHPVACYDNFGLDATVFRACQIEGVQKVYYMSSACAYPIAIQQDLTTDTKLTEDLVDYDNIKQADGAYGTEKVVNEMVLHEYGNAGIFEYAIGRGFTVYGPRVSHTHAIGALIAKSFVKQEPFEVWGDGKQRRNWSFVQDIVRGIILATEKLHNDVVNLGTEEYHTPDEACEIIWDILKWRPNEIIHDTSKPVGTLNRVADASKAKALLGWEPTVSFNDGLRQTIDWYVDTHKVEDVRRSLEVALTER